MHTLRRSPNQLPGRRARLLLARPRAVRLNLPFCGDLLAMTPGLKASRGRRAAPAINPTCSEPCNGAYKKENLVGGAPVLMFYWAPGGIRNLALADGPVVIPVAVLRQMPHALHCQRQRRGTKKKRRRKLPGIMIGLINEISVHLTSSSSATCIVHVHDCMHACILAHNIEHELDMNWRIATPIAFNSQFNATHKINQTKYDHALALAENMAQTNLKK